MWGFEASLACRPCPSSSSSHKGKACVCEGKGFLCWKSTCKICEPSKENYLNASYCALHLLWMFIPVLPLYWWLSFFVCFTENYVQITEIIMCAQYWKLRWVWKYCSTFKSVPFLHAHTSLYSPWAGCQCIRANTEKHTLTCTPNLESWVNWTDVFFWWWEDILKIQCQSYAFKSSTRGKHVSNFVWSSRMLWYRCGSLTVNHLNVSFQGATLTWCSTCGHLDQPFCPCKLPKF